MVTVITGANRGIGRALFERFPDAIGSARNGDDQYLQLDVTDTKSLASFANHPSIQQIDLLICNAGVYLDKGEHLSDGYAPELWAKTFAANVTGVFLTIQALLTNLQAAPAPKIAIIASRMGSQKLAPGGAYIYRASKAAAINVARNLAQDLKPKGIAVGAYHPGWVRTDMGGDGADLSVDEAVNGLLARFDELDLGSTGCFRAYDGEDLPL